MRALGTLLIVCVALVVVKAAVVALLLALVIALIWAACLHPREMLGFMAYFGLFALINAQPALTLAMIGIIVVVGMTKNCDQPP